MRNEPLTGFVLHQKPYRENRSLTYFFSQEFGLVNGIGKKNLPLFVPISVFATGKSDLKSFSQSQLLQNAQPLHGQAQFAGLYLNELLVKLLPPEESCHPLWQAYQQSLNCLANLNHQFFNPNDYLKLLLRQFEQQLFEELGYAIDFSHDNQGELIVPTSHYRYQLQAGFVPVVIAETTGKGQDLTVFLGQDLQVWQNSLQENDADFSDLALLNQMGKLYRQVVDNLLNHQPLQSRELWRELAKYQ